MAAEHARNLQDTFLERARLHRTPLTVFLTNGVKLQGFVADFDTFCVLLRRDNHAQLVYKRAISTMVPLEPVDLHEAAESRSEPQEPTRTVVVETRGRLGSRTVEQTRAPRQTQRGTTPRSGAQGAAVPFMITQVQKVQLRALGYTDEQIREMTPGQAHRLLGLES